MSKNLVNAIYAFILIVAGATGFTSGYITKALLEFPRFATPAAEPKYVYGDRVFISGGFYRGLRGTIIEWTERSDEYIVSTRNTRQRVGEVIPSTVFRVKPDQLKYDRTIDPPRKYDFSKNSWCQ